MRLRDRLAGVVLCVAALSGVAGAQTDITFLSGIGGHRLQELKAIIADFEAAHPEYKVNLVANSGGWPGLEDKLNAMIAGGSAPDLIRLGETGAVAQYAAGGVLQGLDDFVKAGSVDLNDFFPSVLAMGRYQGQLFAVPIDSITSIFIYNGDLLNQAGLNGPAATQSELLTYAQKLSAIVAEPVRVVEPSDPLALAAFAFPNGGRFFVDAGATQPTLDDPAMVAALEYVAQAHKGGLFGTSHSLLDGQSAVRLALPIHVNRIDEAEVLFKPVAALVPAGSAGRTNWGWGHYLGIPKAAKHKEGAWQLIEYLLSRVVSRRWHQQMDYLPAQKSVLIDTPYYAQHPIWRVFFDQLQQSQSVAPTPLWPKIEAAWAGPLEAAWNGEIAPQAALKQVQRQVSALLKG